jgi:cardiolipin synthase
MQMVALCVLLVGEPAGEICACAAVEAGLVMLWIAAVLTLYTGFDYFRAGLKHVMYEL